MRSLLLSPALATIALAAATPDDPSQAAVWQPAVGTNYQMILTGIVDPSVGTINPSKVPIFDVDLFYTNKSTIDTLHEQGKKVICYFSAGSSEDWRPDYSSFTSADKGPCLSGWAGERWLDVRQANVVDVMKKRIALASQKGCDGIDPDNMDGYDNGSNFGLTQQDSITYFKKLATEAHSYGMAIGLKNAQSILPKLINDVQFAVNEECALYDGDCDPYTDLTNAGKPVFHIEYANHNMKNGETIISSNDTDLQGLTSDQLKAKLCLKSNKGFSSTFSTTIKALALDGWVLYCDDSSTTTATVSDGVHKGLKDCPNGN
jgi:endo-alpha-1,4-polygalactosaminidase (GH114 family)